MHLSFLVVSCSRNILHINNQHRDVAHIVQSNIRWDEQPNISNTRVCLKCWPCLQYFTGINDGCCLSAGGLQAANETNIYVETTR